MNGYGEAYKEELAGRLARAKSIAEMGEDLATIRTIGGRYEIYQTAVGIRYYVIEIGEGASEYVTDLREFPEYVDALDYVVGCVRRDDKANRAAG